MDDEHGKSANAVILIFSKTAVQNDDTCKAFRTKIVTAIPESVAGAPRFLHDAGLTGRSHNFAVLEYQTYIPDLESEESLSIARCHELRISSAILAIEQAENVEIVIQPLELYHKHRDPGLAVFDMDSTLIQQEVIDELARSVGRYEQVSAVTEAAMRGELDFEASLRARVKELNGVSTDIWEKLKKDVITFTPGARELVQFLKAHGWKTAVLSGGFTPLAYWVKDVLGLDYAYANQLAVDSSTSTLSGELLADAPIVGAAKKRELLLRLAADNDIPLAQTIAVGDGSNDLLMMNAAGLGIAFNAKAKVQQAAPARLNSSSLLDVAYILGYTEQDIAGSPTSGS